MLVVESASRRFSCFIQTPGTKKASVDEHPEVFDHAGLLYYLARRQNRLALYLVFRQLRLDLLRLKRNSRSVYSSS
jgi:hypothetical protein